MMLGAFDPGHRFKGRGLDLQLFYCLPEDLAWAEQALWQVASRGRRPLITIEPHNGWTIPQLDDWETLLRRYANSAPHGGELPMVRWGHEMNAGKYPWAELPPRAYVDQFRNWAIALEEYAEIVWSPNVSFPGSEPMESFWPGGSVVDWVGIDGYSWNGEPMEAVFEPSLEELQTFGAAGMPLFIAETARAAGPGQVAWVREGAKWLRHTDIEGLVWFNTVKTEEGKVRDWTIPAKNLERFRSGG